MLEHRFADSRSMRALARSLVTDDARADDVVQETALRALEHPPAASGNLEAWLARVARNFAFMSRRKERRALKREQAAARIERGPDVAETLDRQQLQRAVSDALEALDEPYRSTLRLRFYDGYPPRKIAAIQRVGVETVRSRIKRGLAKMRTRLDRSFGDRERWLIAALPFVAGEKSSLFVAAAVLLIAISTAGTAFLRPGSEERNDHGERSTTTAAPDDVPTPAVSPSGEAEAETAAAIPTVLRPEAFKDTATAAGTTDSEGPVVRSKRQATIVARAVDAGGLAIAGAEVRVVDVAGERVAFLDDILFRNVPAALSDQNGVFRLSRDGLRRADRVVISAPGFATSDVPTTLFLTADESGVVEVAIAASTTMRGRLSDDGGAPVPGTIEFIKRGAGGFGNRRFHADEHGRFKADSLAEGEYDVVAAAAGCESKIIQVHAERSPRNVDFILVRTGPAVYGRVAGRDGNPLRAPIGDAHAPRRRTMFIGRDFGVATFQADPRRTPSEMSGVGRRFCRIDVESGRFGAALGGEDAETWIALVVCGSVRPDSVVRVTEPRTPLVFVVDEEALKRDLATIRVDVRDAESGAPIAAAVVRFPSPGMPGYSPPPSDGEFGPFLAGRRTVFVSAPGYRDVVIPDVLVQPGFPGASVEAVMERSP